MAICYLATFTYHYTCRLIHIPHSQHVGYVFGGMQYAVGS